MLAALYNPANPSNLTFLQRLRSECVGRGISLFEFEFKPQVEWESTFSALIAHRPDALQILADSALLEHAGRIAALALTQHLPTLSSVADIAQDGVLLAYGASHSELHRRSAYYVKRILNGSIPSDLPVEQATRISLSINLATAKALGLDVPALLLARADEVIE